MKLLFDHCVPRPLRRYLPEHQIDTAGSRGSAELENGALLARAEPEYDVLITSDRRMRYQQNIAGRRISIVILPTNKLRQLARVMAEIRDAVASAQPGSWHEIRLPT